MGVDGVLVDPGLLLLAQAGQVELTHRDNRVPAGGAHLVAVHVEPVREGVVLLVLLDLLEGRGDEPGVQEPDRGGGLGVLLQLAGRRLRRGVVVGGLHVLQAVGGLGGIDVALDVLGLLALGVGVDDELLDDQRVGGPHHQGGDDHDGHTDDRQAPGAGAHRGDEEDRHGQSDGREDRIGGDDRVDVGVVGAVELGVGGVQGAVTPQPVAHGPDDGVQRQEDCQVHAGGLGEVGLTHHGDTAVQVVDDDRCHPGEQDDAGQEGHERQHRGQDEDVEGDVDPELGVLDSEGLGVEGQKNLSPAGGQLPGRPEQGQHRGHYPGQSTSQGLDDGAVGLEVARGLVVGHPDLPGLVGPGHRDEDGPEHDAESHQEQDDEGDPLRPQHPGVPDLTEPEDLGPHLRKDADGHGDGRDDRDGQGQRAGTAAAFPGARRAGRTGPSPTHASKAEQSG